MIYYAGELAAFGAALCWTAGSQCTEAAGHRVGSMAVNALRLAVATVTLAIWALASGGSVVPQGFTGEQIAWLATSGLIGLVLGDMCLFRAFVEIGPRVSMLIMSLATPLTAVIGWATLGEQYGWRQWAGMAVTLAGVAWVIVERPAEGLTHRAMSVPDARRVRRVRHVTPRGVMLALGGVVGQATGYVMSKRGMGDGDAFAASQVRMLAAIAGFVVLLTAIGYWPRIGRAMRSGVAMVFICGAGAIGTAMGVGLSMLALHYTTTGVAATILATVPILLIPFAIVLHREHVSWRAMAGAAIAFAGIVLLVYDFGGAGATTGR